MASYILILIILVAFALDLYPNVPGSTAEMSQSSTNLMKGLAAVLIAFHHIESRTGGGILTKMNFPAVAVFFFVAGYGTMFGYLKKSGYCRKIVKEKIPNILLLCVASVLLSFLFFELFAEPVTFEEVLSCFMGNRLLNWFFLSLIIKYILFVIAMYISERIGKSKILCLLIATVVYMCACAVLGLNRSWYFSSLAFPLGAYIAQMGERGRRIQNPKAIGAAFFIGSVLLYAGSFLQESGKITKMIYLFCRLFCPLLFSLALFFLCENISSRKIFAYCGQHSAQIILVQEIGLELFRNKYLYIDQNVLYACLAIIGIAVAVLITAPYYNWISSLRKRLLPK